MTEEIQFHSRAGKKLLKMCMGDLYPNPMVVYREYVQNSCDSLQEAEKRGYFQSKVQKIVSIEIKSNSITIHDRGIGVGKDDVVTCLIDLSFSQKNGDAIGRYGIGRLTGAKYCDELIFETSVLGEDVKSIVKFNAKKAREIIASDQELECTDVVDLVTTYVRETENRDYHYFRVTMNNVTERHLLEEDKAKAYLAETIPVDFSAQFKDYVLSPAFEECQEFEKFYSELVSCNVMLNGTSIKKTYESAVINSSNQEEKVGKARFFKLENDGELLAWGWYAMTVSAKQYISTVPFRKIRLRQLNMAIGNETYFDNLYSKDVDSSYFIGEVYAIHKEIEPTTGREGLTDNDYKKIFEHQIKDKFKLMAKEYYALSKFGSEILAPLIENSRNLRIINKEIETGVKNPDDTKAAKCHMIAKLKEVKDKLTDRLAKIRKEQVIVDLIDGIVEYYQDLSDVETDKYNKQKDSQKKNILINKFNISNEIEKLMGDKEKTKKEVEVNQQGAGSPDADSTNTDYQSKVLPTTKTDNSVDTSSNNTKEDELDAYKGMTSLEKSLIRKVYKILNSQKDLAPTIREKIKSKMVKQLTKK